MNAVLIAISLIELAMKVAPDVVQAVGELQKQKGTITLEDIAALRDRIKPPDAYFDNGGAPS